MKKFHLKPFSLLHDRSTMKVGMDSMILGSWINPDNTQNILDIGTGCGILALMLASKCNAQVIAIDLDSESAIEAGKNFSSSSYYQRIKVENIDFNDFVKEKENKFDLIVSNPPYFINDQRSLSSRKSQARHGDTLSYEQIIRGVEKIISKDGILCLVLPYAESLTFIKLATEISELKLQKQMVIFPRRGETPNRVNLQFGFAKTEEIRVEKFVVREENGGFSDQYMKHMAGFLIGQ